MTYLHVQKSSSYLLHRGRTTLIIPRFSGRSKCTYAQSVTNTWSQCTYIGLCGWYKKCIFILTYALNIDIKRSNIVNINLIFNKYSKSKPLAPLNQDIGLVYDTFIYDEDPHFHCIEPTQHNWVSKLKLHQRLQSPSSNDMQSDMATSTIPPGSFAKNHHHTSREPNPLYLVKLPHLCFVGLPSWLCE